jgi:hypothetical protein
MHSKSSDTISQFSVDSSASGDRKDPVYIGAGDIRIFMLVIYSSLRI